MDSETADLGDLCRLGFFFAFFIASKISDLFLLMPSYLRYYTVLISKRNDMNIDCACVSGMHRERSRSLLKY